jgi:hypothetical protein
MAQPTAAAARVGRLTGRGRTDDRGGGLALVELFEPILRTLHEKGDAAHETLVAAVQAGQLGQKTARLQTIYDNANPWSAFLNDALEQLATRGLVTAYDSGRYTIGPKFTAGKSQIVIPAGGGQAAVRVTVQTDEQRAARSGEESSMYITELATELDPRRTGIRPLDMTRVKELVSSMEAFGFRTETPFAVLKDQHGRVLDGRHRIAAAEKLGIEWDNTLHVQTVKVDSDREALALTWTANIGQAGWTDKDLTRISKALGGENPTQLLSTRVQVRNLLLDRAGRIDDREVARLIGCSHITVAARREELEAEGAFGPYDPEGEKRTRIRTELERDPTASDREIGRRLGVSAQTVKAERVTMVVEPVAAQAGQIVQLEHPAPVEPPPPPVVPAPKPPSKGKLIDDELLANPDRSDKEIAELLGMDGPRAPSSVWRRRKKLAGQDPYNGSIEGPRTKPEPPEPAPAPTEPAGPPGSLTLDYTEDARVLAAQSCAWMTDPNVLLEWGNRLVSTAKRRGAS